MEAGAVVVRIMADSTALTAGLSRASGQMAGFSRRASAIGVGMTKYLTLPIVAVGAVSLKMAADFETSMKLIQTQAGGSAKDVTVLSKAVLEMKNVQHGPKELADSLYHLKSVGMDNVQAMNALKLAEQGASVGGSKLEETTNAIAGAWRTGIQGAQSFEQAMGTLNAIVGAGNLRMEDLNSALGTGILVSAKTFGVSLTSVGAALALFTSQGMPATQSATRLRMAISLMGAPTDKAAKLLKGIGIGATDMAKALRRGGIVEAVGLLKDHMQGLSKIQQSTLLSGAFGGARTGTAIMALVDGYDALVEKQNQIIGNTGKFSEAVAAQAEDASAKWHHFLAVLSKDAIVIGNVLLPIATKMAEGLGRVATAFGNLSSGTQSFIVKALGVVAVAGPVVFAAGKMAGAYVALRAAMLGASAVGAAGGAGAGAAGAAGAGAAGASGAGTAAAGAGVAAGAAGIIGTAGFAAIAAAIATAVVTGIQAGQKEAAGGGSVLDTIAAALKGPGDWFSRVAGNTDANGKVISPAMNATKDVVQKLTMQLDGASYGQFQKLYGSIKSIQLLADKGIVLDTKDLGKQAVGDLRNLRSTMVKSLGITAKQAETVLNTMAGHKLNFNWHKQTGKELNKTKATVTSAGGKIVNDLSAAGKRASSGLAKGVGNVGPTRASAARLAAAAKPSPPNTYGVGVSIGAGLAAGMNASLPSVISASMALAHASIVTMHKVVKNPPFPSAVTRKLGQSLAQGLVTGMLDGRGNVSAGARGLALAGIPSMTGGASSRGAANSSGGFRDIVVNVNAPVYGVDELHDVIHSATMAAMEEAQVAEGRSARGSIR